MHKQVLIRDKKTGKVTKKTVKLTDEQINHRKKREARWLEEKPMRDWMIEIQAKDKDMPRSTEDMISVLTKEQKDNLPKETLDRFKAKQELRSKKPKRQK